mmetsp:Transcript_15454/g.39375  ORF Transcript_15454/g.39375 Transcript_15454/m.39375 type:complete len:207 (+) Transcript_15454:4467-5087(+)
MVSLLMSPQFSSSLKCFTASSSSSHPCGTSPFVKFGFLYSFQMAFSAGSSVSGIAAARRAPKPTEQTSTPTASSSLLGAIFTFSSEVLPVPPYTPRVSAIASSVPRAPLHLVSGGAPPPVSPHAIASRRLQQGYLQVCTHVTRVPLALLVLVMARVLPLLLLVLVMTRVLPLLLLVLVMALLLLLLLVLLVVVLLVVVFLVVALAP